MKFSNSKKGFTLIELLVVIAIIGVLSTIILASVSSARQKARNVAMLQEVKQFINALEIYRTSTGSYPAVNNETTNVSWIGKCLKESPGVYCYYGGPTGLAVNDQALTTNMAPYMNLNNIVIDNFPVLPNDSGTPFDQGLVYFTNANIYVGNRNYAPAAKYVAIQWFSEGNSNYQCPAPRPSSVPIQSGIPYTVSSLQNFTVCEIDLAM